MIITIWLLATAVSCAAILSFASGHGRPIAIQRRLHQILGLLLCVIVIIALSQLYTMQKTIFIGLGLLSLCGFATVLIAPLIKQSNRQP